MRPLPRCLPFLFALTVCVTLLPSAHAQRLTPSAVREGDKALGDEAQSNSLASRQDTAERPGYAMPARAFLGVGGAFLGAFAGAYMGASVIPHGPCGCDDPGLSEAIVGAMVGSTLVGAALAAAPQFSSSCHPVRRIGYGVLGAVTGAAAGGVLGATVGGLGVILGYISGAGLGAGLASSVC
jgi:hypothetical protein